MSRTHAAGHAPGDASRDGARRIGEADRAEGDGAPPWLAAGVHRVGRPVQAASWAGVAVLTVLTLWGLVDDDAAAPLAADAAVAVASLALLPLLWSRRQLPAAYVLAALTALGPAATPASTVATIAVARSRSVRAAWPAALAGVAAHAVEGAWRQIPLPYGWWLLCAAAVYAALLGWGAYLRERAELVASWRERARRAERDQAERVARARTDERARIAREMHDTLAHRLTLIATTAGALEFRPDAPPELTSAAAARVREEVSGALDELRGIVHVLRSDEPERHPAPRLEDVPALVESARAAGTDVTFERVGDAPPPPAVALAAYRVAQEGLTNARRHAPGARVRLTIATQPGELTVRVADDGVPRAAPETATLPAGTGTGLIGLAERVELLGGRLTTGARGNGTGYAVVASIPWEPWTPRSGSRSSTTTRSSDPRCG